MVASTNSIQRWATSNAYISASQVEVTGSRGDPVALNYTETGLGPRFSLSFADANEVQFYWISPDNDWRQNQTYRYKMTNSWINGNEKKSDWYFWNINSFIDSEIQIPRGYDGFACDYVELSYWKERTHNQVLQESDAKIQFYDFSIGFLVHNSRHVYNPCQKSGGRCRAIDGSVTCGNAVYWQYGIFVIFALVVLFGCVADQCLRFYGERDFYRRIAPQEEDEEHPEDEILQGLKRQTVVELTGMYNSEDDEEFDDEP